MFDFTFLKMTKILFLSKYYCSQEKTFFIITNGICQSFKVLKFNFQIDWSKILKLYVWYINFELTILFSSIILTLNCNVLQFAKFRLLFLWSTDEDGFFDPSISRRCFSFYNIITYLCKLNWLLVLYFYASKLLTT